MIKHSYVAQLFFPGAMRLCSGSSAVCAVLGQLAADTLVVVLRSRVTHTYTYDNDKSMFRVNYL